jgi:chemotaxis methyl-accepting protein methylase
MTAQDAVYQICEDGDGTVMSRVDLAKAASDLCGKIVPASTAGQYRSNWHKLEVKKAVKYIKDKDKRAQSVTLEHMQLVRRSKLDVVALKNLLPYFATKELLLDTIAGMEELCKCA